MPMTRSISAMPHGNIDRASELARFEAEKTGRRLLMNFDDWKQLEKEVTRHLPPIQQRETKALESSRDNIPVRDLSVRKAGDFRKRKPAAVRLDPLEKQKTSAPSSARLKTSAAVKVENARVKAVRSARPILTNPSACTEVSEGAENNSRSTVQHFEISSPSESNEAVAQFSIGTPEAPHAMSLSVDVSQGRTNVDDHAQLLARRPAFPALPELSCIADEGGASTLSSTVYLPLLESLSEMHDQHCINSVTTPAGQDFSLSCSLVLSPSLPALPHPSPPGIAHEESMTSPAGQDFFLSCPLVLSPSLPPLPPPSPPGTAYEECNVLVTLRQRALLGMLAAAHAGNLSSILQSSSHSSVSQASETHLAGQNPAMETRETQDITSTRASINGDALETPEAFACVSDNSAGKNEHEECTMLQKLRQRASLGMVAAAHAGNLGAILQSSSDIPVPQAIPAKRKAVPRPTSLQSRLYFHQIQRSLQRIHTI